MRRTQHVIAVVVVATALCADRAVASSAQARPAPRVPSRSLASRITTGFKQVVAPRPALLAARTSERVSLFPLPIREAASGVRGELTPLQFPLPPPMR